MPWSPINTNIKNAHHRDATTTPIHTEQIMAECLVCYGWSNTSGSEQNLKVELTKTNYQLIMHIIYL
jgi:hypothetical protein